MRRRRNVQSNRGIAKLAIEGAVLTDRYVNVSPTADAASSSACEGKAKRKHRAAKSLACVASAKVPVMGCSGGPGSPRSRSSLRWLPEAAARPFLRRLGHVHREGAPSQGPV